MIGEIFAAAIVRGRTVERQRRVHSELETRIAERTTQLERANRELELLIPPESLDAFVAETDTRCSDWRIPLQSVAIRQTAREDDSYDNGDEALHSSSSLTSNSQQRRPTPRSRTFHRLPALASR